MRNIYVGSVEDSSDIISQSIDDEVRNLYLEISQPMRTHDCEHTNTHGLPKNIELCYFELTKETREHTVGKS